VNILIRADGGLRLGFGHLVRCLTLAAELMRAGHRVTLVCRAQAGLPEDWVRASGCDLHLLPDETGPEADAVACGQLVAQGAIDAVVVDHYELTAAWEQVVGAGGCGVLAIDDMANRPHRCDMLLDQNYHLDAAARYASLIPVGTRCLLGPEYALLRPAFAAERRTTEPRRGQVGHVLVFFSGGDDQGQTRMAMDALRAWRQGVNVDVVVGHATPGKEEIEAACRDYGYNFHCQIDYMAVLLAKADLVIGAPSTTSWERCAVGAPALLTVLAENQRALGKSLAEYGAVRLIGDAREVMAQDYLAALRQLSGSDIATMSQRAWSLVDGQGASRVRLAMEEMVAARRRAR